MRDVVYNVVKDYRQPGVITWLYYEDAAGDWYDVAVSGSTLTITTHKANTRKAFLYGVEHKEYSYRGGNFKLFYDHRRVL